MLRAGSAKRLASGRASDAANAACKPSKKDAPVLGLTHQ